MTDRERRAWDRYLAAERELDDARWALMAAINASHRRARAANGSEGDALDERLPSTGRASRD
jgi:hypothetical protein